MTKCNIAVKENNTVWDLVMYQYRFNHCDKYMTLMYSVNGEAVGGVRGILLSLQ